MHSSDTEASKLERGELQHPRCPARPRAAAGCTRRQLAIAARATPPRPSGAPVEPEV